MMSTLGPEIEATAVPARVACALAPGPGDRAPGRIVERFEPPGLGSHPRGHCEGAIDA
jgi:hypothetical protein